MFVVDTNLLLYGANEDAPDHAECLALVRQWRVQPLPWYLTWGIVFEFLRVVTHPHAIPHPWTLPHAWRFLESLFASPGLRILRETDRHREVAAEVFAAYPNMSGNLLFDARTAILMRENGVHTIYTRDTDFLRFPFLEAVDPVTQARAIAARRRRRRR